MTIFQFTFNGIAECVPMILFAYMYQVNIPMIYQELERRNHTRMGTVVWRGSLASVIIYASVGVFGYLTFYDKPDELLKQNILLADYGGLNAAIIIVSQANFITHRCLQGQFTSFFSVYAAMPLLYLPSKETVEDLLFKGSRSMTKKENFICTLSLVTISFVFAIFVPSIGDAMALAGCTTNPMVSQHIHIITFYTDRIYYTSHVVLGYPQGKTDSLQREVTLGLGSHHNYTDFSTGFAQFYNLKKAVIKFELD